jgi:Zn-dependent protease with chaperone function
VRLAYPDSQRAEYEADRLAAHTAGTRAAVAALTLAHLGPAYAAQASGLAINAERDFFPAWRTLVERMSERERQRLGRVVRLDATRLDPTLPTSASRLRALRAHQVSVPAVGLSASESARIDAELAPLERPLQVALADRMASALS